jgi:integrase
MASITRHGDDWRVFVFKHGVRATKVCKTKREAQAWALRKELELDAHKRSGGHTFQNAVDRYLKTVSSTKESPDWERRRFDQMLLIIPGETPMALITSDTIANWRDIRLIGNTQFKPVIGDTVRREANLLRHLFSRATDEWKWIPVNPFKGVTLPDEGMARHQRWRWQQIKQVLRAGQASGGKTQEMTEAFHIALRTAMRLSEVLAAPLGFVPSRSVVILIKTKTTKQGKPVEVPVGRIAGQLLTRQPFTVNANEGSVLFSKLCRHQMISDLTFHDARATALTLLARKVDVMTLARVSRHKDISLLHRVYYRETSDEIAAKL